jgi:hypothetical protein
MMGVISAVIASLLFGEETSFATTMFLFTEKCCQKKSKLCLLNKIYDKIMGIC